MNIATKLPLLLCLIGLMPSLLPPVAAAATVLSNTDLSPDSPGTMGPGNYPGMFGEEGMHSVQAQSFTTGSESYVLGSITPFISSASGGGFSMALYANGDGTPGELLATLTGNTMPEQGLGNSYAPSSTVVLDADTTYWWVASIDAGISEGRADMVVNPPGNFSANSAEGWSVGHSAQQTTYGDVTGDWNVDGTYAVLFQVDATLAAAPEPTRMLLLGLGTFGLLLRRRRLRMNGRVSLKPPAG
jgi:hypothetical protein